MLLLNNLRTVQLEKEKNKPIETNEIEIVSE